MLVGLPSNAIFYLDKFNERMETANKLIHKSSKLRGMNTVYAKQQHRQNPEEKKMTFKEIQ